MTQPLEGVWEGSHTDDFRIKSQQQGFCWNQTLIRLKIKVKSWHDVLLRALTVWPHPFLLLLPSRFDPPGAGPVHPESPAARGGGVAATRGGGPSCLSGLRLPSEGRRDGDEREGGSAQCEHQRHRRPVPPTENLLLCWIQQHNHLLLPAAQHAAQQRQRYHSKQHRHHDNAGTDCH